MRAMKRQLPWILGLAFVLIVLLTRTWGIQVDENAYFDIAIREPLGDSRFTGKPLLFYVVNYGVYHLLRGPAGWMHPLILPVFYIVLTVVSLWRLAGAAEAVGAKRQVTFALLLLSPIALFNATQLMMEAALLPLLSLTMATLVSMTGDDSRRRSAVWLAVTAALGALLKETAIPALLLVAVAFVPLLGRRIWPLALGVVAGALGNRLLLWIISAPSPASTYGGIGQLISASLNAGAWRKTPPYLGLWVFFLGVPWLGAAWSWWTRRDAVARTLAMLGILTASGTVAVRLATDIPVEFPRYMYPVLWVGLVAALIACARSRVIWVQGVVLAVQVVMITALWPPTFQTIRIWPSLVTTEAYANGGTILSGAPSYGWIATSPRALQHLCVYLPQAHATGRDQALLWFQNVATRVGFYDETHVSEFDACSGAKVIVDRRFGIDSCDTDCRPSLYRIRSCIAETVLYYSREYGDLKSRVCLP